MGCNDQLSSIAQRLRQLTEGTPEREQYLERLAADIREGRYQVDSYALADKIIDQLLRRPRETSS